MHSQLHLAVLASEIKQQEKQQAQREEAAP